MKKQYAQNWQFLFHLADLGSLDKPLTPKILTNSSHPTVKHIMYLYTMESFIYEDMNRASRDKDSTKIKYYGAFAAALSYIIYNGSQNKRTRVKSHSFATPKVELFRGVKLTQSEIESYVPGNKMSLKGYTSTSKDMGIALGFAFMNFQAQAKEESMDKSLSTLSISNGNFFNQRLPVVF